MHAIRKVVVVVYFARRVYPLRNAIETHLFCWKRYSRHRTVYVNLAFGFPERLIRRLDIDAIIFHTSFLGMRWGRAIFPKYMDRCSYLGRLQCTKIAIPQDEFINTDLLNRFINEFGVTHILSCADERDWRAIYDEVDARKVTIGVALTGYLDAATLGRIETKKTAAKRAVDIGYRAWRAAYWLGEHGQHKTRIADIVQRHAPSLGLKTDISLNEEDVLGGDSWFDFLLACKSTIGAEGGASVLDREGKIRHAVERFLEDHPAASFEETRARCFPNDDHKLNLACISPRHLEACATETCQLLVEGRYSGVLIPWKHYIPVRKDYSNIAEALDMLRDDEAIKRITSTAYDDVIKSGKWTYLAFVQMVERTIIDNVPPIERLYGAPFQRLICWALDVVDKIKWGLIRFEVSLLSGKRRLKLAQYLHRLVAGPRQA